MVVKGNNKMTSITLNRRLSKYNIRIDHLDYHYIIYKDENPIHIAHKINDIIKIMVKEGYEI